MGEGRPSSAVALLRRVEGERGRSVPANLDQGIPKMPSPCPSPVRRERETFLTRSGTIDPRYKSHPPQAGRAREASGPSVHYHQTTQRDIGAPSTVSAPSRRRIHTRRGGARRSNGRVHGLDLPPIFQDSRLPRWIDAMGP
jgi:hypothetical protein